jgi:hypothetical protein
MLLSSGLATTKPKRNLTDWLQFWRLRKSESTQLSAPLTYKMNTENIGTTHTGGIHTAKACLNTQQFQWFSKQHQVTEQLAPDTFASYQHIAHSPHEFNSPDDDKQTKGSLPVQL